LERKSPLQDFVTAGFAVALMASIFARPAIEAADFSWSAAR